MCLRTDLWPHRKEVQALPIERDRERENPPWSLSGSPVATDRALGLSQGDLQVCPIWATQTELRVREKKGEGFIIFLLFHLQTWIIEIPDSPRVCWVSLTMNVLSDGDNMSVVLPVVAVGQSGFIWTHQQVYVVFCSEQIFPVNPDIAHLIQCICHICQMKICKQFKQQQFK